MRLNVLTKLSAICLAIFLTSCASKSPTLLTASSDLVPAERKAQKVFDCNTLSQSSIPETTQRDVLSLLPKRLPGETDPAYRERLDSPLLQGIFDWWNTEVGDAKRHTVYCAV